MVSILGATPGTELYTRLCEEGRWVPDNKEYGGGMFPVMHYYNFSQKESSLQPQHWHQTYENHMLHLHQPG